MINLGILIIMLLIHWYADFIMQTDEQAKNKSTSNIALTNHILTYTSVWMVYVCVYSCLYHNYIIYWFIPITFICHWITDYITSRFVKFFFNKNDYHNGFIVIGFDQFLHITQLVLTYYILTK